MRDVLCVAVLALGFAATAAAELPRGDAAQLGFDPQGLASLDAAIEARIDAGAFPGAVIMVARDGRIAHLSSLGARSEGGGPMPEDAIFRIYSMTKPVTSVVAMQLVEEGRLQLAAPVSRYLGDAWAALTVATGRAADGSIETEAARRQPTVQDLLRHTAGLSYGFFGSGPARAAMDAANLENGGFSNREVAAKLAQLPLEHHPGEVWEYSRATDVLGAVIEVVDGRSLGAAMQARIFDPLRMVDTGFWIDDAAAHARLAETRPEDRMIGSLEVFDPRRERAFESGGGGLVSTIHDYARFAQMLLNGGELDGARILSPATVAYMKADHLGDIPGGRYYLPGPGYGFGLGFGVRRAAGVAPFIGSPGEFYWGGAAGTYVVWDPAEDLFILYMMASPANRLAMRPILRNMVYGALTRSRLAADRCTTQPTGDP